VQIQNELERLYEIRVYINLRIEILEAEQPKQTRKAQIPLKGGKVLCIQIAPFIREWIDSGRTLVALAQEAMVSEKTVRNILSGEYKFTHDSIADAVMTAMGHQHNHLIDPPLSHYWED
jgi:hypothetical protein